MGAIDQAKRHFNEKSTKEIIVPEWADESGPLVIYSDPITMAEKNRIKKRSDRDNFEALAFAVIMKAMDAQGNKLFTVKDKHDLMNNVDPDVLARIASEIMEVEEVTEKK